MCTFVTLIAKIDDPARLNDILAARDRRGDRRRAEALETACLRPLLRPGEGAYLLHNGGCDCGTCLGSALWRDERATTRSAAAQLRYRRAGWSGAKIARALADHDRAVAQKAPRRPTEAPSYWIGLLHAIAAGLDLTRLGLLHHRYIRAPGAEDFAAGRREAGPLATASDVLLRMPDGIIHDFDCRA